MAVEFSLVPGPSLDIVGIPDLEVFKKFINGDLGISDSIYDSFIQKSTAGIKGETLKTFIDLCDNKNDFSGGIKGFEKTIIQSVFETQKPYIEIAKAVLDGLVIAEDIIAAALAGFADKSLKPISNPESLYSKLNKIEEDLNETNKLTQPSYNSFKNIPEEERKEGISIDKLNSIYQDKPTELKEVNIDITSGNINYDFITVSVYYSTGTFIEGIPYKYTYRYIVDDPNNNNSSNGDPNADPIKLPRDRVDDKKSIIIFDIWVDDNGDGQNLRKITNDQISELPWDIQDKWLGNWGSWSKDPLIFKEEYINYVNSSTNDELDLNNITDIEIRGQINNMVINSIPFDDTELNINFYNEFINSSIYKKVVEYGGPLSENWITSDIFGIKPMKINGIWYDPETDYYTQIIKISPSYDEPVGNNNITNNPLSNKYDSSDISDVLIPSDYNSEKFKYITIDGDTTNRIRHDETYIDENQNIISDKKIYYIIEGVYKDRVESIDTNGSNSGIDPLTQSKKYYKFGKPVIRLGKSIAYIISRFIKFASKYISKIISLISKAITLLTKPFNFIFEILLEKVGDIFDMFSPEIVGKVLELKSKANIEEKKEFVESDVLLKRMVAFDIDGNYRLINDGAGFTSFLGVGFGIGMKEMSPKLSIDFNPNIESLIGEADEYISGAGSLSESSDDKAESINLQLKAMEKLQIAQNLDPDNTEVQERMDKLQNQVGVQSNMLFQAISEIISLPIKIILKVINYILDFFKSLSPTKLLTKIPEFLTFKWIMDFFKPSIIFELLGIKIDPSQLVTWASELATKSISTIKEYDTSKILSAPFIGKLDIYDTNTLPSIINGGSKILILVTNLFKFIQEIINKILCFLFNVFNIDKLIKCPKIDLSKFSDGSLSQEEISLLLEQDDINFMAQIDINQGNEVIDEINRLIYRYDVRLEDGTIVSDLNYEELQAFISNHENLDYKYNY